MKEQFVYILQCNDGSLYTGWTTDLANRINKHNEGKGAKYTRAHRPVKLVYYEIYNDKNMALKREYQIKQFSRKEKLDLINNAEQNKIAK